MNDRKHSFAFIKLLYYLLLAGQLLMGGLIYYIMKESGPQDHGEHPYQLVIPLVVVLGIALSRWVWRKQKEGAPASGTLTVKLMHYRASLIVRAALAEGANLLALVLTFLMGNIVYLLWFAVGVTAFGMLRPTVDEFAEEYRLTDAEKMKLRK